MAAAARSRLEDALGDAIHFDVECRKLTSLRVGGKADAVAEPLDRGQLAALLRICAEFDLPCRALGRGFNTVVGDDGVDGVLVRLNRFKTLERRHDHLFVEAGVSHASVTAFCREHGLAGLEFAAGIPGSLGGWIAMNAGIGPREMKDVVAEVEVMAHDGSGSTIRPRAKLDFAYRKFQSLPAGDIVVSASLIVEESTPAKVKAAIDELLAKRQATQPLDVPSCGSVFKNPEGGFAGQLIEEAGLKGAEVGGAMISTLHANFIVNCGDATAGDVLELIERAREGVRESQGVELETEVHILGRAQ